MPVFIAEFIGRQLAIPKAGETGHMKKVLAVLFVGSLLSGCSSHPIRREVYEKIQVGDDSNRVVELFGYPDEFSGTASTGQWKYLRRADVCKFTIEKFKVQEVSCEETPDYVSTGSKIASALGDVLSGAGQGRQVQTPATINAPLICSTSYSYGSAQTICQ